MQQAVCDATAAGPLIPNELPMMGANPSVRVGPKPDEKASLRARLMNEARKGGMRFPALPST